MYSDVKNVRLLVALLKKYDIKTAVLSSGTCSIPVIHSMEMDPFFKCYSDIDERSAVYFAIGISQMSRKPVAVVCTSGTAACNYLPGVCEAMKQNVPIVIITCDKDENALGHMTIQKINQHNIFASNCKKSVCLPVIKDQVDDWACQTMISQALICMNSDQKGPVHINIYTDGDKKTFNTPDLPSVKKIERLDYSALINKKSKIDKFLRSQSKILIVTGEIYTLSQECIKKIESFCKKYGAFWSAEHVANTHSKISANTYKVFEQLTANEFKDKFKPDLVISMGENYASYGIKALLKQCSFTHWHINPKGTIVDIWRSINCVFACNVIDFFSVFEYDNSSVVESEYQIIWKNKIKSIQIPIEDFTSLAVVKCICSKIDCCGIVHMGILNSTRLGHLFDFPQNIKAYSNLGALGIDGSLSTFLGQASVNTNQTALCIIGDLSFFYDINSLCNEKIPSNIRIVLLNNGGGSEFHLNTGIDLIPMIDDFISAGHSNKVAGWIEALGLRYYSAYNEKELNSILDSFFSYDGPALLEVFTDIEKDSLAIKKMYKANGYSYEGLHKSAKAKKYLTKVIGVKKTQKLVRMAKIWKEK